MSPARPDLTQPPEPPTSSGPAQRPEDRATASQLALEVLHEARNPLESLANLNFLALEQAGDPEKVRRYLRLAEEQIATLSRIATHSLAFAKAPQNRAPIDLVHLAEAALRMHKRSIDTKKIHLVKKLPKDLVAEMPGDQILHAFSHFILNALEALPESGTLFLRLRKRAKRIDFLVADNGRGIAPEHHHRLFEPFFSTKQGPGTGLGLAISKRIIEDHRGKVRLRTNVRPGRSGTAIKITFSLED